jgi:hypothetical protein
MFRWKQEAATARWTASRDEEGMQELVADWAATVADRAARAVEAHRAEAVRAVRAVRAERAPRAVRVEWAVAMAVAVGAAATVEVAMAEAARAVATVEAAVGVDSVAVV